MVRDQTPKTDFGGVDPSMENVISKEHRANSV